MGKRGKFTQDFPHMTNGGESGERDNLKFNGVRGLNPTSIQVLNPAKFKYKKYD